MDENRDLRPMAHRYFGAELGDAYVANNSWDGWLAYILRPERWRTVDFRKMRPL